MALTSEVVDPATPALWFNILSQHTENYPNYNAVDKEIVVQLEHNMADVANLLKMDVDFTSSFQNVIDEVFKSDNYTDYDKVSIHINGKKMREPIYVGFQDFKDLEAYKILKRIDGISQSSKVFLMEGKLEFKFLNN